VINKNQLGINETMSTDINLKGPEIKSDISSKRRRILTGVQPTGDLHLGNYFGAIKPAIELSQVVQNEVVLMCVNWHALTNKSLILESGALTPKVLATFLALGFQSEGNSLLVQGDFPEILENAWYLSCVASVGLLERATAFKDSVANGKDPTCGLFYYPILMASDIMSFDAELVPVGKDQAQHLEYASDLGKMFNNTVKKQVFKEAKAMIQETPLLPGTDGIRKMSKSYNNAIPLFGDLKEVEKKIKEITTDSKGLDDVKDPETSVIYKIFESFAGPEALAHMKQKLEHGVGYGYGHAKQDFFQEYKRVFAEKRELYEHYVNNPQEVALQLEAGKQRMKEVARDVSARARRALGF
jgi:tryptophanyl-tRNA synthetase